MYPKCKCVQFCRLLQGVYTYVVETLNGGTQLSLLHSLFSDLPIQKPDGTPGEEEIQGEKEGKRDNKEEDEGPFSSSISVRQPDGIGAMVRCPTILILCIQNVNVYNSVGYYRVYLRC